MKLFTVVMSMFVLALFAMPGISQENPAHHPAQAQTVQADSAAGAGMMSGGMMGGKGMMMGGKSKKQCGMMGGKGMKQGGMMGHKGMMGGMSMMGMKDPMHKYMHTVKHLPDLQTKLNLTDDQVSKLKQLRADFLKKLADWKASLEKKSIDLGMLLDKNASASEVKKMLSSYYDVKVTIKVNAYEVANKMRSLLSMQQREQFDSTIGKCKMMGSMM